MGFLDRLLGRDEPQQNYYPPQNAPAPAQQPAARSDDEIAVERYRYLLRTAPPETIEQVHEEAFTKLTPEQRHLLFTQLSENAPAGDAPRGEDPRSLAQSATRSEIRQPGTMERSFNGAGQGNGGQGGGGMGFGGMLASSMLGTVAGYVIGSAIVSSFLPGPGADQAADSGADNGDNGNGDTGGDGGGTDASGDASGDVTADGGGWGDSGGGDWSGGSGDFGGGDFGGDFGF